VRSATRCHHPDRSIAVLPFTSLSPDPHNAFFTDGLTAEIITDLSRVHDRRVISRNSAVCYKDSDKDARTITRTISRELNVRYLLQGSVRRAGISLCITGYLEAVRAGVSTRVRGGSQVQRVSGAVREPLLRVVPYSATPPPAQSRSKPAR
jgi:adenylate cyclase